MELLRRVSVRTRLMCGFVAVCGLLISVTLMGIRTSYDQERLARRTDRLLVLTRDMGQVKYRISDIGGWQLSYAWEVTWAGSAHAVNPASPSRRAFEDSRAALDRELDAVERGPMTASEREHLAEVRTLVAAFSEVDAEIVRLLKTGTPEGVRAANELVLVESYEIVREIQAAVSALVVSVSERSAQAQALAEKDTEFGRRVQLAGSMTALLLAALVSLLIAESIVGTARHLVRGLRGLVEHEESPQLPVTGRDEFTEIARAFNETASLLDTAHAEQRDLTDQLRELAIRDPLTGLLNRAEFLDRTDAAVERARRDGGCLVAILIDLNDFKPVNDSLGHAAGDVVLRRIADRLRGQVRETDAVARLGGDEFAILIQGGRAVERAEGLSERIKSAVEATVLVNGISVAVTASVGVRVDCAGALSSAELLGAADAAMYIDKRRQRGQRERGGNGG